jgi:hypothetical protein
MPFCTKCGASVAGAFCNQCGTPVSAAAQEQPAPAAGYQQPVGPGVTPGPRKTSPVVWILVIVLGLFVLGGIATVGVIGFVAHRAARQAGLAIDRSRDGGVSFNVRGADGKDARVEFGTSVGKLPSWVPVYPGSEGRATFAVRGTGNGEGEGGNFTFTTSDDGARVKAFYADKCKDLGMKVNLETTTPEGGMFIAADEGGEKRSLTVVIGGHGGQTTVNVTYGSKFN